MNTALICILRQIIFHTLYIHKSRMSMTKRKLQHQAPIPMLISVSSTCCLVNDLNTKYAGLRTQFHFGSRNLQMASILQPEAPASSIQWRVICASSSQRITCLFSFLCKTIKRRFHIFRWFKSKFALRKLAP